MELGIEPRGHPRELLDNTATSPPQDRMDGQCILQIVFAIKPSFTLVQCIFVGLELLQLVMPTRFVLTLQELHLILITLRILTNG